MAVNLKNVQGDTFSKGFSKRAETYYFFSIASSKEKDFTKALNKLATQGHISSLAKVLDDWQAINAQITKDAPAKANDPKFETLVPVSNALIGFSKTGLDRIQTGLTSNLGLDKLLSSDPAFAGGMANDQGNLNDPLPDKWDDMFKTPKTPIHGILKVAGSTTKMVDDKLNAIKNVLGSTIVDIPATSPPTTVQSRIDGQVRPKEKELNGHEHFGFEDGVSQPLLEGIDEQDAIKKDQRMLTPQDVITIQDPAAKQRPPWMKEGSFLVFRKLEQNVPEFKKLMDSFAAHENKTPREKTTPDRCAAKLMGRWKNGAPIVLFKDNPPANKVALASNDFTFSNDTNNVCPLAAHIRKTNPRIGFKSAHIVRNGIPYGSELDDPNPTKTRGLLFACYQSSIENGFQFIQKTWINNKDFPGKEAGFDVFTAQPPGDGPLNITLFDQTQKPIAVKHPDFKKVVTMRGGEYFFVPSIDALKNTLGSV